ncbi:hypothetical protein ZIOFF_061477 [Zingiber officinale]|uniref:Uncharacterized protein n=1 Tax=Zingiber officinale TaxID=94328 RepID=A0A8J5K8E5_ZINOF|nr:hypothetical protein ZIOFF_061477 [Zingiber officinale]
MAFDRISNFEGVYANLHTPAVIIGGVCVLIALVLSTILILQHLQSYSKPAVSYVYVFMPFCRFIYALVFLMMIMRSIVGPRHTLTAHRPADKMSHPHSNNTNSRASRLDGRKTRRKSGDTAEGRIYAKSSGDNYYTANKVNCGSAGVCYRLAGNGYNDDGYGRLRQRPADVSATGGDGAGPLEMLGVGDAVRGSGGGADCWTQR